MLAQLLQIIFQLVVDMRAAHHHQRRVRIADADRLPHALLFFPGLAALRQIQYVYRRRVHHAHHRLPLFNQGDIDRELTVAVQELFGAVQRIDQPVTRPAAALFPRRRIFFRQQRHLGRQRRQAALDDVMRRQIGRRHR